MNKLKRFVVNTSPCPTLDKVITFREAVEVFAVSRGALTNAILKGYIRSRQSGATWLLFQPDLEKFYDYRIEENENVVD